MPGRTLTPTAAAGTGWTNPNNALASDGNKAVQPAGGTGNWLRLTNVSNGPIPTNETVIGFEVSVVGASGAQAFLDAGGSDISRQGHGALLSGQSLVACTDEAWNTCDADLTGSYYGHDGAGSGQGLTVIHDLGSTQDVGVITLTFTAPTNTSVTFATSTDGSSWTNTTNLAYDPANPSGASVSTPTEYQVKVATTTTRYVRVSIIGGGGVRIYDFRVYGPIGGI